MTENIESGQDNGEGKGLVSTHVSAYGATVYMNRKALRELITQLEKISEADPSECWHVHLGWHFSYFTSNETYVTPPIKYFDGLSKVFGNIKEDHLKQATANDGMLQDAVPTPFEVTFMHIGDEELKEEINSPEELRADAGSSAQTHSSWSVTC